VLVRQHRQVQEVLRRAELTRPRRAAVFGPEPWAEIAGMSWSHFDRWFALVATSDFGGDLDALRLALEQRLRDTLSGRRDVEAKLSHLADLRERLSAAGAGVRTLATCEAADTTSPAKTTLAKARRKVLDQALDGRSMTEPMRVTPRSRLVERARYGHWELFPVSPAGWYPRLGGDGSSTGFVRKGSSFAAARRLGRRLAQCDSARLGVGERLALHRAFHTVGLELADRADDSYGVIGELRADAFRTYVSIDWAAAGMRAEDYWQDLCELLVAEPYALTHRQETLAFERVGDEHAEIVEAILRRLAAEWRVAYQDFCAERAEQLVAWLHVARRRYERYVDTARALGSRTWMPIVALAESALSADDAPLALVVFRAADQPGAHRDYLRRRCYELTGWQAPFSVGPE
jgi:hypothetical protein